MTVRIAMNLLWCVPGVGGSEEYLVRQLHGLHETAADVHVEVFAPRGFAARQPLVAERFTVHEAPNDCTRREVRVVLEHTWLAARTRGFDLVHHGGGTLPRTGNARTLLTIHDIQWTEYPHYVSPLKLRYLRATVPSSARRATRIAVPTSYVRATLARDLSVDPGKVGVVRHGLEAHLDATATPEEQLRHRFGLGDGPVLVFPAITHPHKNHAFLLDLLSQADGPWADPSLRVVFAGSAGASEHDVRARIHAPGIDGRVVMPGRVSHEDRNGLLAMADAMVFPSEYEGFGAPVIEAMRFGTPVISSDRACLPEVVGDAGIVAPLTVEAWNAALVSARRDRARLVAAGHERARTFTAAESARDLVREYSLVLGGAA